MSKKNSKSDRRTLLPKDFTNSELREALSYYQKCVKNGFFPDTVDFKREYRCSTEKAAMLYNATAWAYKIQEKEKAQFEAKRRKAC